MKSNDAYNNMDKSQNNYNEWEKLEGKKRVYALCESIYINYAKYKLIYNARDHISGFLIIGGGETWTGGKWEFRKDHEETSGIDGYIHCLDYGNDFTGEYMSVIIPLYTFNVYSLFCHLCFNEVVETL